MNKAILMGRLTKDPEVRYTANNVPVASFSLAIDRRFTKPGEEKQTDFINIVAWQKLAEFCGKYYKKGQQVLIVGRIQTRTWDDAEGKKHYATEVVADEAYFADSKKNDDGSAPYNAGPDRNTKGTQTEQTEGFFPSPSEEDLPF
jgi:single-strand DNA-binding protein